MITALNLCVSFSWEAVQSSSLQTHSDCSVLAILANPSESNCGQSESDCDCLETGRFPPGEVAAATFFSCYSSVTEPLEELQSFAFPHQSHISAVEAATCLTS